MDITIHPSPLSGKLSIIPSKSQAHRLLICAAFSDSETDLICPETNQDIEATAQCLRQICENIQRTNWGYRVLPRSRKNIENLSVTLN
jgi:3-phosphoshikimate 1-carboxyvinyltransferase